MALIIIKLKRGWSSDCTHHYINCILPVHEEWLVPNPNGQIISLLHHTQMIEHHSPPLPSRINAHYNHAYYSMCNGALTYYFVLQDIIQALCGEILYHRPVQRFERSCWPRGGSGTAGSSGEPTIDRTSLQENDISLMEPGPCAVSCFARVVWRYGGIKPWWNNNKPLVPLYMGNIFTTLFHDCQPISPGCILTYWQY